MTGDPIPDGGIEIPLRFTGLEEGRTSADAIFNSLTSNADRLQSRLDSFRTQMMELGRATNPWMAARTMGSSLSSPEERLRSVGYSAPSSDINLQNLLARSLHPTSGSSSSSPWLSMTTREGEGLADVFRRLRTVGGNLGDVLSDSGKRVTSSAKAVFDVFRASAFGRSLGLRSIGPGGKLEQLTPDSFARALGRFMAARSVGGILNAGFEYAKNPLQDNFAINRAQKATNNVINTLATTGSPTAAIISGLSSVIMSNIERRNELHTMRYNFDQASIDTRRSVAAQGSDWAFNQIKGMYSRPEQIRMLQERAAVRRGTMVYDTEAIDQMQIPRPAEGIAKENAAMAELNKRFGLGKYAALVSGAENTGESQASSVETKAVEVRKAAEDAGVKAAEARKEAAVADRQASEKRKSAVSKEIEELSSREKEIQKELEAHDKKYVGGELQGKEKELVDLREKDYQKMLDSVHKRQKEINEGSLAKKKEYVGQDGQRYEWNELEALKKRERIATNGLESVAASRNAPNEKRSEIVDRLFEVQERKRILELQEAQGGVRGNGDKKSESGKKKSKEEATRERLIRLNIDPETGMAKHKMNDSVWEELRAHNASVASHSANVAGAASKAKDAANEAADGFTVNNPLPVRYNFEKGRRAKLEDEVKAEEEGDVSEIAKSLFKNTGLSLGLPMKGPMSFKKFMDIYEQQKEIGGPFAGNMEKVVDAYLAKSGNKRGQLAGYDKNLIDEVHKGNFKNTDMASLKEALDIAKSNNIDFDKDRNFAKIRDVYQQQERLAEAEELQAKQLKYDPSQVMNQYMEASRVNDSMSRQGFFIGSQVDVQDVNRDILAEVKKVIPLLSKMASREVGVSGLGLSPDSTFK